MGTRIARKHLYTISEAKCFTTDTLDYFNGSIKFFFNNNNYLFIFVVWKISHHCASYIFVPAMILLDVLSELDMDMECMSEFSPVRDTDVEDNKGVLFVFCYIS